MSDHSNVHNLPALASSTSLEASQRTWSEKLKPAPVSEVVALLTTCLTLVRPVGMSDENASTWLRIAAGEVRDLPRDLLVDGCAHARKTCTHHGQIVPAILKETEERLATRRKLASPVEKFETLPAPAPWKPTPEELAELKANVGQRVGAGRS
jgi:hypothetical protein